MAPLLPTARQLLAVGHARPPPLWPGPSAPVAQVTPPSAVTRKLVPAATRQSLAARAGDAGQGLVGARGSALPRCAAVRAGQDVTYTDGTY
jgi:hypothetical protein